MYGARASRLVVAPAAFHHAAFVIHVPRSHPVGETVVGPVLAPPLRCHSEIPGDAQELFAAEPIGGMGVEDPAGVVLKENAVAGENLQPGIHVLSSVVACRIHTLHACPPWPRLRRPPHRAASYAFFNASMSILFIFSIAAMTRFDFSGALSCSISTRTVGTICHDTPNLSLSHPHCTSWPPAESFSQKWSTSSCVSQFTTNDIASVNLKSGPPFNATNSCPSSSNATVMTDSFGLPEAFAASSS